MVDGEGLSNEDLVGYVSDDKKSFGLSQRGYRWDASLTVTVGNCSCQFWIFFCYSGTFSVDKFVKQFLHHVEHEQVQSSRRISRQNCICCFQYGHDHHGHCI